MKTLLLAAAAALCLPAAAQAGSITGTVKGLTYTVKNTIIGQTSTATIAGGGNPIYLGQTGPYRGTVGILMDYGSQGQFVCSGSLVGGGSSVLTAGHCMNVGGVRPDSVTVFFYNGNPADVPVYTPGAPGVTTVAASRVYVNPLYTGEVIDDHDVAVLRLASAAPSWATSYGLYTGDPTGQDYNIAGYGGRSDTGGSVGVNLGVGRLRQGLNTYDFTFGDPRFFGFWDGFFGSAEVTNTLIADFDNGRTANDASCQLGSYFGTSDFCNTGLGAREVSSAGGDSGGPQFVDGKVASVTSFGLTFGTDFGDIDNKLNDTWGEFNGFAGVFNNLAFIQGAIPEPATWATMIAGFGLVGAMARRRRTAGAAA
jgi:hypothetical protein